jgi:hypothetical protein
VAVGPAAPVQPRDRLLADVAALGEADGAIVEARLLGDDGVVEVGPIARAAALDAQDLGGVLFGCDRACREQRFAHAIGVGAVADDVDARVGAHQQDIGAGDLRGRVVVLVLADSAGELLRARADQRQQAALERALVQLAVEADLEAPQGVEERLEGRSLAEEQQLASGIEHAQVGEHLALVREQRGVAAAAGLEGLDLVADLPVEELLRSGARQRELPALGAVDEGGALRHGCIGVHRDESYRPT